MNDMINNFQNKSSSPFNFPDEFDPFGTNIHKPSLKVLGLGGGGSNAINRMIELGLSGVDFIVANTDAQALNNSLAPTKIQLGPKTTAGIRCWRKPRSRPKRSGGKFKTDCRGFGRCRYGIPDCGDGRWDWDWFYPRRCKNCQVNRCSNHCSCDNAILV